MATLTLPTRNVATFETRDVALAVRSMLRGDASSLVALSSKSMSVGSDADGGYATVPILNDAMERVMSEAVPMLDDVNTVTLNGGRVKEAE